MLAVPAARAQCVLCYMSANSTGARGASVLRAGILVLLVPTLLIFGGLLLLVLRRREPAATADDAEAHSDEEALLPLPAGRENQSPSAL